MSTRRSSIAQIGLVVLITTLSACSGSAGTEDVARYAQQVIEKLGLAETATTPIEDWLKATKARTGLTFGSIVGKVDEVWPTVVKTPPIRSTADAFAAANSVPNEYAKVVEDVFVGTMCDTASTIAQGKPVDADSIVEATITSAARTLGENIQLAILRTKLQANVREFARAKSPDEAAAVSTDISFTLECFALGKLVD